MALEASRFIISQSLQIQCALLSSKGMSFLTVKPSLGPECPAGLVQHYFWCIIILAKASAGQIMPSVTSLQPVYLQNMPSVTHVGPSPSAQVSRNFVNSPADDAQVGTAPDICSPGSAGLMGVNGSKSYFCHYSESIWLQYTRDRSIEQESALTYKGFAQQTCTSSSLGGRSMGCWHGRGQLL